MTMDKIDVLIIGGGISGLASAWWLARGGLSVEVWEADERPGGKIMSTRQDGYLTERAASMVLNFRPEVAELVRDAGLEQAKTIRMPGAEARRYLLHQGSLNALPMRLGAMVASPLWSLRGKLRLLAEPFVFLGGKSDESVSEFISRRLGREVLEKAMEPFVAGMLAADADKAARPVRSAWIRSLPWFYWTRKDEFARHTTDTTLRNTWTGSSSKRSRSCSPKESTESACPGSVEPMRGLACLAALRWAASSVVRRSCLFDDEGTDRG